MAIHIQRKKFDHPALAKEAVDGFTSFDPSIPGAAVKAVAHNVDDEHWVYVTQSGDLVNGDEPLLPDYERVNPR